MKNNLIFQSWINETKEGQLLQTKPHSKTQLQIAFEAGQRYEQIKNNKNKLATIPHQIIYYASSSS